MCLVNVSSRSFNPLEFIYLAGLVVLAEIHCNRSCVSGADSSTISYIYHIYVIVYSHYKIGTASTFTVVNFLGFLIFLVNARDIFFICFMAPFYDSSVDVMREIGLHDYLVVEVLLQGLCALVASVAIIHGENLNFGPIDLWHFWLFRYWLYNIQNNSNSILISFSYQPNMCVGCKRSDDTKPFIGCLRILKSSQVRPSTKIESARRGLSRYVVIFSNHFVLLPVLRRHGFWGF